MNDDDLLQILARTLVDDDPPDHAIEAAYAAHGWRTLDAELAELLEDSQVEVVLFSQAAYTRVLSYSTTRGTIELGIDDNDFELVAVPPPDRVRLHRSSGATELTVDDDGRARGRAAAGPVRFEVSWPDGSAVTPWTTL